MPRIHIETFRVRSYECDLYEHVNNAVYVRYLQETALNASLAAGLGPKRLADMDLHQWMQTIEIEYLTPLFYGETVQVACLPLSAEGYFLRQRFEFRKAGDGTLAAWAVAASTFLRNADQETVPVPPIFRKAFFSEGEHTAFTDPTPFSPIPSPPPGLYQTRHQVDWVDVNAQRQVEHAMLLAYVEDCGRQVVAAHGWPMERMLAEGFAILLRRNQIEYTLPAVLEDRLEISTWVSQVRRVSAVRHYTVRRIQDDKILAHVHALGVWVHLKTGQPIRIPADLLADFAPNIVSG